MVADAILKKIKNCKSPQPIDQFDEIWNGDACQPSGLDSRKC